MENYKLVMPEDLNPHGFLFGGKLLMWVDEYAYIGAKLEFPDCNLVTVAMDNVVFRKSAGLGMVLKFEVSRSLLGRTSAAVHGRRARRERPVGGIDVYDRGHLRSGRRRRRQAATARAGRGIEATSVTGHGPLGSIIRGGNDEHQMATISACLPSPKKHPVVYDATAHGGSTRDAVHSMLLSIASSLNSSIEELEIVGHQAGNPLQYPQSASKIVGRTRSAFPVLPVSALMGAAFDEMGLDAIEIDVQSAPDGDGRAFVMHDRPTARELQDALVSGYLAANTIERAVRHFAERGYHAQGKRIYTEIKTTSSLGELDGDDVTTISRLASAIDDAVRDNPQAAQVREQLGFASFNLQALEMARGLVEGHGHTFHFIAGTNRPLYKLLARLVGESRLEDELVRRLRDASWLTGIWFDPLWVPDYARLFPSIDESWERKLNFGLAMYYSGEERFKRIVQKPKNQPFGNVSSVIFEFVSRAHHEADVS